MFTLAKARNLQGLEGDFTLLISSFLSLKVPITVPRAGNQWETYLEEGLTSNILMSPVT